MKKVLILFGGNSPEHEISCKSVNFIKKHIDTNKFKYEIVGIDKKDNWYIVKKNETISKDWKNISSEKIDNIIAYLKTFDIVFSIIHGNTCEDGKLQSLFELFNIKYVGCNSYSSIICFDKLLTKLILEKHNIPQVPYIIYNKNNIKSIEYPVIVKPCKSGSSIGISVCYNKKQLNKAIAFAKKYDNNVIIEKYLKRKRELECAVLINKNKIFISNIGEIINNNSLYDFNSKYKKDTKTIISNLDIKTKKEIQKLTKKIFYLLNCKQISRIDFLYDTNEKKLYFNEINTIPGFTDISMYPKLIEDIGISYKKLITILLSD